MHKKTKSQPTQYWKNEAWFDRVDALVLYREVTGVVLYQATKRFLMSNSKLVALPIILH